MGNVPGQIGLYEIIREIGRGGMGVVYLARDTKLDRDVAIKALPEELAEDPVRLERFEREAKALAQLNHPNVAGIHGVEEQDGQRYLVLEYVEGDTLGERLDRGSIPVDEAIEIAIGIASGVEAAHEAGVIHRDLKPDNIKITPDGKVKVLDFGLAKTEEASTTTGQGDSPTVVSRHSPTIPGAILGTAAYMSPEQARGRKVDKRADIWSFGVIVFEMLVGASPFAGESAHDSIGAVLHKDLDLDRLPRETPAGVRRVLKRCVVRDKALRYRDIGDVRIELLRVEDEFAADEVGRSSGLGLVSWIVLGVLAVFIGAGSWFGAITTQAVVPAVRFESDLLPGTGLELAVAISPVRLSPDGQRLAFLAYRSTDNWVLCVRELQTGLETVLRGPVRPEAPFWSPDGRYLAYFSGSRLERIAISGGRPEILAEVGQDEFRICGDWDKSGRILFSAMRGPVMMLEPGSDTPIEVIDPVPGRAGDWAVMPTFLPGGEHVLYFNQDDVTADSGIYVGSLADGTSKRLLAIESSAQYVAPGWLVYWRAGGLHRYRFDLDRMELVGDSELVASQVWRRDWPAFASFSVTPETLVYVPDESDGQNNGFFFYDLETGAETPLGLTGSLWGPAISPDGTILAFDRTVDSTAGDIVVFDLERKIETPLSRDQSNETEPVWTPDGRWVYFVRGSNLYRVRSDGSGSPEPVLVNANEKFPQDIAPDGRTMMFSETRDSMDLVALDLKTGESVDWLATQFDERTAKWNKKGDLVAYTSNASGETRVMVARATGERSVTGVSRGVGGDPRWSGNSLFYVTRSDLVSVEMTEDQAGELVVGEPEVVLTLEGIRDYVTMPDGKRLLLNRNLKPTRGGLMKIVRNWMPPDPE